MEEVVETLRPGPSCTSFHANYIACSRCGMLAKLTQTEPRGDSSERLTFHCGSCDGVEQFLTKK